MPYGVLIIEDEATLAKNIQTYLKKHGYDVRTSGTGEDGLKAFADFKPDIVLLDYNLPGRNGLEVLEEVRRIDTQVKVILVTGDGSIQVAVDAMKAGAYDYVSKPLVMRELRLLIDKAVGQDRMEGALSYYRRREAEDSGLARILGRSPAMISLRQRLVQLLDIERRLTEGPPPSVLITGETGTGKELVARALHFDGARRDAPFVEINCASIPAHLLESELLGYERGAFTDARERKLGLIETAHGGTLFLDEIGEMAPALQAKLLKLLEDRKVRRLGATRDREVDIRIVTATNRVLEDMVRDGRFRSDLYYRLGVVQVELPPLRDRGDDVLMLAEHVVRELGRRYGRSDLSLGASAGQCLLRHDWPGNVRELRNVIEQAVLLTPGTSIEADHLSIQTTAMVARSGMGEPVTEPRGSAVIPSGMKLEDVERSVIVRALDDTNWNVTRAAESLGISRDTLRYRIEKFGLKPSS